MSEPSMPMEAPVTSATAGPIQQMAANAEAKSVPVLEMFSFFIALNVDFIHKKYSLSIVIMQRRAEPRALFSVSHPPFTFLYFLNPDC